MSLTEQGAQDTVVRGAELGDLARLYEPDIMLVTAPVPLSPEAEAHAAALVGSEPHSDQVEVHTGEGAQAADALLRLARGGDGSAEPYAAYLAEVVEVFASLLEARRVGVRQVVADGPHCPRFHVDQVVARGVLNVVGPSTEWLAEADVDRSRLGHAGGLDDATSGLVRSGAQLHRAELATLAVFKGSAWPGAEERAIVHRSPPADGSRRLVLTLDWMD